MVFEGKTLRKKYLSLFKERIDLLREKNLTLPGLAVLLVGENPASLSYINAKKKLAKEIGLGFWLETFSVNAQECEVKQAIEGFNQNPAVSGIIIQLPLPSGFNVRSILSSVSPEKDVDGLSDSNLGALMAGSPSFVPCTPLGIIKILEEYKIPTEGKHVVILGRSPLVGRSLANLLSLSPYNSTVTIIHSKTPYADVYTRMASIIVVATGIPRLLKPEMVSKGAVVIDVGISRGIAGLTGDVDFERVKEKASFITPVPGGVGIMTVTMLLYNTIKACYRQQGLEFLEENTRKPV